MQCIRKVSSPSLFPSLFIPNDVSNTQSPFLQPHFPRFLHSPHSHLSLLHPYYFNKHLFPFPLAAGGSTAATHRRKREQCRENRYIAEIDTHMDMNRYCARPARWKSRDEKASSRYKAETQGNTETHAKCIAGKKSEHARDRPAFVSELLIGRSRKHERREVARATRRRGGSGAREGEKTRATFKVGAGRVAS